MPAELCHRRRAVVLGLVVAPAAFAQPADAPSVVASFSILADFARAVAPAGLAITSLVGPGADAHVFEPRAADARRVAQADLLVVNGLGFDPWAERLALGVGFKGRLVRAASAVQPLTGAAPSGAHPSGAGHAQSHAHGSHAHGSHAHDIDPHAWQDVTQAQLYVRAIAAGLAQILPAQTDEIAARLAAYGGELVRLDRDIRAALAAIPATRRVLVTGHSSMAYFARAYGLRILAAKGMSTASEPSAAQIARLIRQIRTERIAAVFLDTLKDPRLIERIKAETGARTGGKLFADSLSPPGGPAPTYLAMMRHNAKTIATALSA